MDASYVCPVQSFKLIDFSSYPRPNPSASSRRCFCAASISKDHAPHHVSFLARVFCVRLCGTIFLTALVKLESVAMKLCDKHRSSGRHPRTQSPGAHIGAVCEVVELHGFDWRLKKLKSQELSE